MRTSRGRILQISLTVLIAVVYLLFPTKNYYWDGVEFATQIESAPALAPALFHPSHLIYNSFGSIVYAAARLFDSNIRALAALQIANALLGACCAFVLFGILRRAFVSDYLAAVFTALFAFSATWWKFATDADAYIASVLFLLVAFRFLLFAETGKPFLVAAAHAAAMLFHQLAFFFAPVVVARLLLDPNVKSAKQRFLNVAQYSITSGLLVFGGYAAAFRLQNNGFNAPDFARWLTYYSTENGFSFDAAKNLGYTLRGHTRLFFDGRFNFARPNESVFDAGLLAALVVLLLVFAFKLVRYRVDFKYFKNFKKNLGAHKQLILLCAIWWATYTIFLFFFIAQNTFYRLFYLPAIVILLAAACAAVEIPTNKARLALFAAVVAIANFLFFIEPYSRVRAETPLALATQLNRVWNAQTVVYYALPNSDATLIRYFNRSTEWRQTSDFDLEKLTIQTQSDLQRGANVWLETTAIEKIKQTLGGDAWLTEHADAETEFKLRDPAYKVNFVRIAR